MALVSSRGYSCRKLFSNIDRLVPDDLAVRDGEPLFLAV